jgi:hypothetical protein
LAGDLEQKKKVLRLMQKVASSQPQILPDVMQLVESSWGQDLPLEYRLHFAVQLCGQVSRSSTGVRTSVNSWLQSSSSFWQQAVSAELNACLRGV